MSDHPLQYERMVEDAMRRVMRDALREAADHGLPGDHHFYIGFRTDAPGVRLSLALKAQYPDVMTIVLQFQFWNLTVTRSGFSVELSFGGKRERLQVPFSAVTRFVDPSVEFGLEFAGAPGLADTAADAAPEPAGEAAPEATTIGVPAPETEAGGEQDEGAKGGKGAEKVVSLDSFRKK